MSGRKSSEVSSLLSISLRSRDEINRNIEYSINDNIKKNTNLEKKMKQIKEEGNINLDISSQIIDPSQIKELQELLNKIKQEKSKLISIELLNFNEELNKKRNIEENFNRLDAKINDIQRRIQNKWDYCDSEYYEANSLVNTYQNDRNTVNKLVSDISKKFQKNLEKVSEAEINLRNIRSLKDDFEIKTKGMINSNNLVYVKDIFSSIDVSIAKKFMFTEYENIKKEVENLSTQNIETNFLNMKSKIEKFIEELREIYNIYLFKKDRTETSFVELQEMMKNFTLNNIESYIKKKEDLMGLYDFAEKYKVEGVSRENYQNNIEKIKNLISKEDFDAAYILIEKSKEILDGEKEILNKEYERIITQAEYAQKIALAGKDLNYDIKISPSEEGLQDGFNITLTMGDEIIEFEPRIATDGTASLNIDHTESTSGSCGATMENVMKAMQNRGVVITDILKNGNSVIYGGKVKAKDKSKNKVTSTK